MLTIPEMCADSIIALYHSSLFVGYQGVIKTYLMLCKAVHASNQLQC